MHGNNKNEIKTKEEECKTRRVNMESTAKKIGHRLNQKTRSHDGLTIALAYRPPESLLTAEVDELPNHRHR